MGITMDRPDVLGVACGVEWGETTVDVVGAGVTVALRTGIVSWPDPEPSDTLLPTELTTKPLRDDELLWPATTGGLYLRGLHVADIGLLEDQAVECWPYGREDEDLWGYGR